MDDLFTTKVLFSNTVFANYVNGYVYRSGHISPSQLTFDNITVDIKGGDEWVDIEYEAFFEFVAVDEVTINGLTIDYSYDLNKCSSPNFEWIDDGIINVSIQYSHCLCPPILMMNYGAVSMDDVRLNVNISSPTLLDWFNSSNPYSFTHKLQGFDYDYGFIRNRGTMTISNMTIEDSVHDILFFNDGTFSLHGFSQDVFEESAFDINTLRSNVIVYQYDSGSSVTISNSHFVGTSTAIYSNGGSVNVTGSYFQRNSFPIYSPSREPSTESIHIEQCQFMQFGPYSGPYSGVCSECQYGSVSIRYYDASQMWLDAGTVTILDSTFRGYVPQGLVHVIVDDGYIVSGNTFKIVADVLLNGVDADNLVMTARTSNVTFAAIGLVIVYGENPMVTDNTFLVNEVDKTVPWIHFSNFFKITVCLSGNVFTNYAFEVGECTSGFAQNLGSDYPDITSCARLGLIDSVVGNDDYYGDIRAEFFDSVGTFIIDDDNVPYIFKAKSTSNIALDNIRINVSANIDANPVVYIEDGTLLLVDAVIQEV